MKFEKDKALLQFKSHIILIVSVLVLTIGLTLFTDIFQNFEGSLIARFIQMIAGVVVLVAVLTILSKILKMLIEVRENGAKLEKISASLEKIRAVLTQVNQSACLSETARAIAYRDADKQSLREAVFDKLQRQDFEAAYEVIDEISRSTIYAELARQLRADADRYRDATDQERVNQVIANIGQLLENYQWIKASHQIERLIDLDPASEKAKAMRQKLVDKKAERKKILLAAWDDAVKRQATDRSLEILRELDLYLTPNEGLALQEAARDVFRTKLHNMGVQFALNISEKQWEKAIETGTHIIRDFPNSRMATEIRDKMEILRQKSGH